MRLCAKFSGASRYALEENRGKVSPIPFLASPLKAGGIPSYARVLSSLLLAFSAFSLFFFAPSALKTFGLD